MRAVFLDRLKIVENQIFNLTLIEIKIEGKKMQVIKEFRTPAGAFSFS